MIEHTSKVEILKALLEIIKELRAIRKLLEKRN